MPKRISVEYHHHARCQFQIDRLHLLVLCACVQLTREKTAVFGGGITQRNEYGVSEEREEESEGSIVFPFVSVLSLSLFLYLSVSM